MTAPSASPMLVRDGDDWILTGCGESCRLRDSRGLHLLAQLIAAPGRELHVLDLAASGSPVDIGDAGAALDDQARVSYRARVKELRQAIDDAEARGDAARAVRAEAELAAVAAELSRAVGLGGRGRRVGLAAERARVNVQRRIADALRRIAEQAPGLGRHFGRAIRTGVYCSYLPERAATTKTPTTDSAGS